MGLQHRQHLFGGDTQPALRRAVTDDIIHIRRRDVCPIGAFLLPLRGKVGKGLPDLHFVTHHIVSQPPRLHVVLIDVGTYDFLSICHIIYDLIIYHVRSPIPTTKVLLFFDMSDHKIMGGCSTLLAKSNKKMHFSRPRSCVYQKNVVPLQPILKVH